MDIIFVVFMNEVINVWDIIIIKNVMDYSILMEYVFYYLIIL